MSVLICVFNLSSVFPPGRVWKSGKYFDAKQVIFQFRMKCFYRHAELYEQCLSVTPHLTGDG